MRGRLKEGRRAQEEDSPDIDPGAMGALIEESQDIHRDAMVATTTSLDEMVETGFEARAHGEVDLDESRYEAARRSRLFTGAAFGGGLLAAAGVGAAFQGLFSSPPSRHQPPMSRSSRPRLPSRRWRWRPTKPR